MFVGRIFAQVHSRITRAAPAFTTPAVQRTVKGGSAKGAILERLHTSALWPVLGLRSAPAASFRSGGSGAPHFPVSVL